MKIDSYRRVGSIEEAYELLTEKSGAAIIGGGAWLKLMPKTIDTAIDLSDLGLDKVTGLENEYEIGCMVKLRQLEKFTPFQMIFDGILIQSAGSIMGVTVRNIATAGGTVAGKYGFSDLLPVLLAMDAEVELYKRGRLKLEQFMDETGVLKDILTRIYIRKTEGRGWFYTMKNTAIDFPILNAAITSSQKGCRIVIGARPYKAALAKKAMQFIDRIEKPGEVEIIEAANIAAGELKFGSNQRGSSDYRRELCITFVKRGLRKVLL